MALGRGCWRAFLLDFASVKWIRMEWGRRKGFSVLRRAEQVQRLRGENFAGVIEDSWMGECMLVVCGFPN